MLSLTKRDKLRVNGKYKKHYDGLVGLELNLIQIESRSLSLTLTPALSLRERGHSSLSLRERAKVRAAIKINSKYRVIKNYCFQFGLGLLVFFSSKSANSFNCSFCISTNSFHCSWRNKSIFSCNIMISSSAFKFTS